MGNRWEDVEELFVTCAGRDLETAGWVHPALAAFRGEELRFLAWLRPFAKGCYDDPVIELLALAMPLDADRLAFSVGGRAWSLDDPIPPVTDDADLRQRILVIHAVDGAGGETACSSVIYPFDVDGGEVRWGDEQRLGAGEGWIAEALECAVKGRRRLRAPDAEIRKQARRVVMLGHKLYLAPEVAERLYVADASRN